jgi:hypothetical protein
MSQIATGLLRGQFQFAHNWFEGTVGDIAAEQMHWAAGGKTSPISGMYAHVILAEDAFVNAMLKGGAPLFASTFAGKTGLSEIPSNPALGEWANHITVDPKAVRVYGKAVQESLDAYLANLQDDDLQKPFDLSMIGMGMQTVGMVLNLTLLNVYCHAGEISAIKGLQGLKGYPG